MKLNYQTFVEDLSDKVRKIKNKFSGPFFHGKTKSKATPDILTDGISEYSDPAPKADIFTKYFQFVFNEEYRLFERPVSTSGT